MDSDKDTEALSREVMLLKVEMLVCAADKLREERENMKIEKERLRLEHKVLLMEKQRLEAECEAKKRLLQSQSNTGNY